MSLIWYSTLFSPAFYSRHPLFWPFPQKLEGTAFVASHFEPARFQFEDFARCAIDPPAAIRRSVVKRQAEFLAGRLCAQQALRSLGVPPIAPAMNADRSPQWPAGTAGSITHSDGWAAAIATRDPAWRSLGLDAERVLDSDQAQTVMADVLTPRERHRLPLKHRHIQITRIFSLKESLFKALYPLIRRHFYFEDAELIEWHSNGFARLRLLCDLSSEWRSGTEIDGQFCQHGNHLLSVIAIGAR